MDLVDRLRDAVEREQRQDPRAYAVNPVPLTWGDLRAILALVGAQGHTPGHCPSCDGHSCPDVG